MAQTKLTADLSRHLEQTKESEILDIIIEIEPKNSLSDLPENENLSRQEKIAARQQNFVKQSADVENAVRQVGGEVVGRAWINQTLKARVPASSVKKISEHQNIFTVDIPKLMEKD